jgi:hypothetical protein
LLLNKADNLTDEDHEAAHIVRELSYDLARAIAVAQALATIVRERKPDKFTGCWQHKNLGSSPWRASFAVSRAINPPCILHFQLNRVMGTLKAMSLG